MIKINKNKNKGISLIVLLITIAVMLILLTVIVISVDNVSNNSKLSAFATDLSTIEDLTSTYYMQNNSFPVKTENGKEIKDMIMTQGDLLNKVGNENKDKFIEELQLNNDYNDESDDLGEYYPIDLSKLDVGSSKRGIAKDGDSQDIYVVSYPSMNIYYIKGVKAKKDIYFSLSSKLTNRVKLNKDMAYKSDSTTSIQSIEGLTVKKMTKSWTNSMGIYVQANLNKDEDIYLEATNVEKKKLITNEGNNEFSFNDLSEVNGFTLDESNTFKNSVQSSKKIIFTKQKGTDVLGKIEVDMSNYETDLPTYSINPLNIVYSEEYNMIPFKVGDSTSGIKEVRYEYLTKYDSKGNLQNYYSNISEYNEEYLKSKGKRAIADKDGNIALKVDKDIQGIQLIVIDKAGNVLSQNSNNDILTIGLYNEPDDIYIGFDTKINIDKLFSYSLVILSNKNISRYSYEFFNDNMNSINNILVWFNGSEIKTYYRDNKLTDHEIVKYVSITVVNSDSKEAKRLFKIDEKDTLELGKIVDENITFDLQDTGTYYNPIIPKGFAPINDGDAKWGTATGWTKGLVIKDEKGNEFVWVPVTKGTYVKDFNFQSYYGANENNTIDDTLPNGITDETVDIEKYGGFYIARYEAGIPEGDTSTNDKTGIPVSKKGAIVWTDLSYANAKASAESMYNTESVQSGLLTGKSWDTTCHFIEDYIITLNENSSLEDSTYYGNFINSTFTYINSSGENTTKQSESCLKIPAGSTEYTNTKNIYDLAGNVYEFTSELYSTNCICRGSSYEFSGDDVAVSFRGGLNMSDAIDNVGFRVRLYIK